MTEPFRRMSLGAGAVMIALGAAAAVYASTRLNTAAGPGPFMGRRPSFSRLGGPGGLWPLRMFAQKLGLTDAQKEQIKGIAEAHRDEWQSLAERAASARKALHDAVTADPIDEAAIRQRSVEAAGVQADIAVAHAHARAEMFLVLTPEQQAQARAMLQGRHKR